MLLLKHNWTRLWTNWIGYNTMKQRFLSIEDFKKRAKKRAPKDAQLLKFTSGGVEDLTQKDMLEFADSGNGSREDLRLKFVISTNAIDRDNDSIDVNGWDFGNFSKGGSVLWSHDPTLAPIARPRSVFVEDGRLKSVAEFTPQDLNPFGYMIYRMFKQKFMSGVSVGFAPKAWEFSEERDGGINFQKQELLEYSATPIPSNPQALIEAKSVGIDLDPMSQWVESELDGRLSMFDDDDYIIVRRSKLENVYATLNTKTTVVLSGDVRTADDIMDQLKKGSAEMHVKSVGESISEVDAEVRAEEAALLAELAGSEIPAETVAAASAATPAAVSSEKKEEPAPYLTIDQFMELDEDEEIEIEGIEEFFEIEE